MLCPNCGSYIGAGEPYCPNCLYGGRRSSTSQEPESKEISREEYFYRQAKTSSINGDHSAAIEFYNEALKSTFLGSGNWDTLSAIAGEYEAMGVYDSARRYWNKCREIESSSPNFAPDQIAKRGDFLYRRGNYEEAIDAYEEALNSLRAMKDGQTGIGKVKVCARIIHFITDSYDKIGKDINRKKYQNELKRTIDRFIQTRKFEGIKNKAHYLSEMAWTLYEDDGVIDEALIIMESAIELHPDSPAEYYNIKAIILDKGGQFEKALRYYDWALSKEPSNETFLKNKAGCIKYKLEMDVLFNRVKRHDLVLIDEAIKILPESLDNWPYFKVKGDILDQLGDPVKASMCRALGAKRYDEVEKAEKQLKKLKLSETYINITGIHNYHHFEPFKEGRVVDLVKEPNNPHDRNAIRVEISGETVGYVANSKYTLINRLKAQKTLKI